jgi:glycosyltransferase involved in cell wall biosynthesis
LKIALISTPFFGVPPPSYGGLERIVYDLWQGLLRRGHKVACFSPDPTITPEGGYHISTGKAKNTVGVDWVASEREMYEGYKKKLGNFDIVHGHNWMGFEYRAKADNKDLRVCHTHHGHLNSSWWCRSKPPFPLNFIAISRWMKSCYDTGYGGEKCQIPSQAAYNMVDMDEYPFQKDKSDRLMFLGRIDPIKAPHMAVMVANRTKMPLDIVGGTSFVSDQNYVTEVRGMCKDDIRFIGEVDHKTKLAYLQDAKALIIPSQFGEPFGLIAVEAMACGTIPVALNDGALGEIVEDGKSGFICNNPNELAKVVQDKLDTINPEDCRKRAEQFSIERGAERYEQLYELILEGETW